MKNNVFPLFTVDSVQNCWLCGLTNHKKVERVRFKLANHKTEYTEYKNSHLTFKGTMF